MDVEEEDDGQSRSVGKDKAKTHNPSTLTRSEDRQHKCDGSGVEKMSSHRRILHGFSSVVPSVLSSSVPRSRFHSQGKLRGGSVPAPLPSRPRRNNPPRLCTPSHSFSSPCRTLLPATLSTTTPSHVFFTPLSASPTDVDQTPWPKPSLPVLPLGPSVQIGSSRRDSV